VTFDNRAAFQPAFALVGDPSFLPGDKHRGIGMIGEAMSLVSCIDRGA
jgi:hypothetical protein